MTAHIKMEIEGSPAEVMEAFKTLAGIQTKVVFSSKPPMPPEQLAKEVEKKIRSDQVKARQRCQNCHKELTFDQARRGNKYCSSSCAARHQAPTRQRKVAPPAADRHCLKCDKLLSGSQKKFCSKHCANSFNAAQRAEAKLPPMELIETALPPSFPTTPKGKKPFQVEITAGVGVTKGSVN